jgi:hypothetical protein
MYFQKVKSKKFFNVLMWSVTCQDKTLIFCEKHRDAVYFFPLRKVALGWGLDFGMAFKGPEKMLFL